MLHDVGRGATFHLQTHHAAQSRDDGVIRLRPFRRWHRGVKPLDPSEEVGVRTAPFDVRLGRQHHIGPTRRLREEEVLNHQEPRLGQGRGQVRVVTRGVRSHHVQGFGRAQGIGQVVHRAEAHVPGALVVVAGPYGHQSAVGLARVTGGEQHMRGRLRQGGRPGEVHPFLTIDNDEVTRLLQPLSPPASFFHERHQGFTFLPIAIAHHVGRVTFDFRGPRVHDHQCRAPLRGFLHPEPEDRCLFLQVRCHHHDDISFTPTAGVVTHAQAHPVRPFTAAQEGVQHLTATQMVRQAGQIEKVFITEPARSQGHQARTRLLEGLGHLLQGLLPGRRAQFTVLPHQGLGEPFTVLGEMIRGETALVANPDFVHVLVLPGHDPLYREAAAKFRLAADIEHDVATHRAQVAHRGRVEHLPGPGIKAEIRGGQRAHRTDVRGIARPVGVKGRVRGGDDVRSATPPIQGQNGVFGNFLLEAHAPSADDAPLPVKDDEVTQRHPLFQMQFELIGKATGTRSIGHGQVLQRTFPAFVTNRTIQRVRRQQELQDVLPRAGHLFRVRDHDHALLHLHGAGRLQFGEEANLGRAILVAKDFPCGPVAFGQTHLHQAHAAHAHGFHLGVITKHRNVNAHQSCRIHNGDARGHSDLLAVNGHGDLLGGHGAFTSGRWWSSSCQSVGAERVPQISCKHFCTSGRGRCHSQATSSQKPESTALTQRPRGSSETR